MYPHVTQFETIALQRRRRAELQAAFRRSQSELTPRRRRQLVRVLHTLRAGA
jgi:hypothetical protein